MSEVLILNKLFYFVVGFKAIGNIWLFYMGVSDMCCRFKAALLIVGNQLQLICLVLFQALTWAVVGLETIPMLLYFSA